MVKEKEIEGGNKVLWDEILKGGRVRWSQKKKREGRGERGRGALKKKFLKRMETARETGGSHKDHRKGSKGKEERGLGEKGLGVLWGGKEKWKRGEEGT